MAPTTRGASTSPRYFSHSTDGLAHSFKVRLSPIESTVRFYVSGISETTAYLIAKERWKFNMLFCEKQEAHFIPMPKGRGFRASLL
jgi:hypothetical protein